MSQDDAHLRTVYACVVRPWKNYGQATEDISHMILQRCTPFAHHLLTGIDTPYKQGIFQTRLDFQKRITDHAGAAVSIHPHGMVHMWISDYNYYPKLTCEHTRWLPWSTFAVRPITLRHAPFSDHLTTRTMLSLHRTTLAFVTQRTHQDVRHIARSITHRCTTLACWRFRPCMLSCEHFFHANIEHSSLARHFGRIRSCNNCERPLKLRLWIRY